MSSRRTTMFAAALVASALSAVTVLSGPALADDQGPGSSKGGKVMDPAPAGVELTTLLPEKISVDNKSHKSTITATVKNTGSKDSDDIRLLVVGFEGLRIDDVKGCSALAEKDLPEGSNSAFSCPVGPLASGASKSYTVDASYDLNKKGRICLPVRTSDGKKTFWQQGPVPFGTTNPSPDAPTTPLLLGTDNVPAAPGADELPKTGAGEAAVPLGAGAGALVAAGAAGMWWARRRRTQG
ncbi:LPXTG cell wall anchor domain-containing protein [Streptomyces sp. NPDC006186]|uniref:LPXTG cell wall anchor domain-containing protein n=1 Tax=Streptomyces sp. NPDC006186 TaxID=3155248 RepID=UPI0033B00B6E